MIFSANTSQVEPNTDPDSVIFGNQYFLKGTQTIKSKADSGRQAVRSTSTFFVKLTKIDEGQHATSVSDHTKLMIPDGKMIFYAQITSSNYLRSHSTQTHVSPQVYSVEGFARKFRRRRFGFAHHPGTFTQHKRPSQHLFFDHLNRVLLFLPFSIRCSCASLPLRVTEKKDLAFWRNLWRFILNDGGLRRSSWSVLGGLFEWKQVYHTFIGELP